MTLLKDNTSAGPNVFNSRSLDLPDSKLPAILVMTNDDPVNVEKTNDHHKVHRFRSLDLELNVVVPKSVTNYQDSIDDLITEIDEIIWKAEACDLLHPCINKLDYEGDSCGFDANGDQTLGYASVNYTIEYTQNIRIDSNDLDDFGLAYTKVELNPNSDFMEGKVELET